MPTMRLTFEPYTLQLRHAFTIASSSRSTTPVVLTRIEYDGMTGYGEASLPPYIGETQESVMAFLNAVDLTQFPQPLELEDILIYVHGLAPGNAAAKASVDIALHDLAGRILQRPWHVLWGLSPQRAPHTSFTIGIDEPSVVARKTREAADYRVLKIKLGKGNDRAMVNAVRAVTDVPISVDVNQGWDDRASALDTVEWLAQRNCLFVEQPFPRERVDDIAWLSARSPLPIMADEGVQGVADLRAAVGVYGGINIKLMKCGGMREAMKMVTTARALGMRVMVGCMTETSCAISAAAQLSPLVDWADLDGALLIANDCFEGVRILDGRVTLDDTPGIGIRRGLSCNG